MKKTSKILLLTFIFLGIYSTCNAQLWKKIKKKAEDKIIDKIEKEIDPEEEKETTEADDEYESSAAAPDFWRNFKFVPGEKVIFYDNLKFEEVGEFPSRWDLVKGNAEVAKMNGEKVIILTAQNGNIIKPLFKNTGYLGNEFTIEYDILIPNFFDEKIWWMENEIFFDSRIRAKSVEINYARNNATLMGWASNSNFKIESINAGNQNEWHHISISYYKGKFKMYYDNRRISNIPNFDVNPEIFAFNLFCRSNDKKKHPYMAIKNIRIAHGGGEMYKRIIADGKYVTNGIIFDSGKTEIKNTSLGIINKMASLMDENKDWNIEIIGHTDSDGDDTTNLKLSADRAEAVKKAILEQGIDATRITVVGKGESEPINTNATPEEKANNRRVVFIKK